jgi:hypothetical protein
MLRKQRGFQDEIAVSRRGTDAFALSLWDRAESAEAFHRATYPEQTKLLVKFVKGTPQVVMNFHLAQNCSCNSRLTSVYLLERNSWRSLWLLREVGTDRKRRKPPVRRQDDLHESGCDSMRCDSKRAQSLGERKTARNLEPNEVFLVCRGRQEFRLWLPKVKMWYAGRSNFEDVTTLMTNITKWRL